MSETGFQISTFKELIENFYKIKKRILQNRPISSKESKVKEYISLLIKSYNDILFYTKPFNNRISESSQKEIFCKIIHCRELLCKCFCKLNCKIKIPFGVDLFEEIKRDILTESESEADASASESGSETSIGEEYNFRLESKGTDSKNISSMASIEEKTKFITMCSNIIRENYDGNPLNLSSFLDKINLIQEITAPNLNTCLISFLKSKLDGKAREVLPDSITSIDQIKDLLKAGIKPDSSKVVAGRIAGLYIKDNNYTLFAKNVEDLADALRRSLVIEGMTKEKAREMSIESTVNVCRNNAKSDMVKAILASSVFHEPKDVVAKLIIEESNTQKDSQILSMRFGNHRSNFNRRGGDFNYSRGGNHNNFHFARGGSNNLYRGRSQYNNYRGHNNYNRSQGNTYPSHGSNTSGNNDGRNARNNSRRQGASVRALNSEAPQQIVLREEEEER